MPSVPATVRTIVTPEQFDRLYQALPDADTQLLVETDIESGLRWGELVELRVRDVDLTTRIVTVSRKVIEVNKKFHPEGKRFLVVNYPKDKESRRFKLSMQICLKLAGHIASLGLGPDDLLFARRNQARPPIPFAPDADPADLGFIDSDENTGTARSAATPAASAGVGTAVGLTRLTGPNVGHVGRTARTGRAVPRGRAWPTSMSTYRGTGSAGTCGRRPVRPLNWG